MKFSLRTIDICRRKLGMEVLKGFEFTEDTNLNNLLEEQLKEDFESLYQNEIIQIEENVIHFNYRAYKIFGLMTAPEQFVMFENAVKNLRVRVYVKDAYYVGVVEHTDVLAADDYNRFIITFLPTVKEVVGMFVHASLIDDIEKQQLENVGDKEIQITRVAWDKEQNIISNEVIKGIYENDRILCRMDEKKEEIKEFQCNTSELVNMTTDWLLDKIKKLYNKEDE